MKNILINIWQFGKKLAIWKKIDGELMYWKKIQHKRKLSMHITVILFGLVYRKDGNYYSKVFLEKFILNFFREV